MTAIEVRKAKHSGKPSWEVWYDARLVCICMYRRGARTLRDLLEHLSPRSEDPRFILSGLERARLRGINDEEGRPVLHNAELPITVRPERAKAAIQEAASKLLEEVELQRVFRARKAARTGDATQTRGCGGWAPYEPYELSHGDQVQLEERVRATTPPQDI